MGNTSLNIINPLYSNTLNIKSVVNISGSVSNLTLLPGEIAQVKYYQSTSPTHIQTTTTAETELILTASITPKYIDSTIKVEFNSSMMLGDSELIVALYRKIGTGSFTAIIPINVSGALTQLGWFYDLNSWRNVEVPYFDLPGTTEQVTYQLRYRKWSNATVNYLVHQTMYYGWVLTEIKS
jgi:hypothetical protein